MLLALSDNSSFSECKADINVCNIDSELKKRLKTEKYKINVKKSTKKMKKPLKTH